MKRSAALAPLSRDHQHALDAALRLRRATEETAADVIARFQRFFDDEGRRHFDIEERLLLPALPGDDPEWAPGVARVRTDHDFIRARADALGASPPARADVAAARALGERLGAHVRFEERELFVTLERRLAPDALERLGDAVAQAEAD